MNEFFIVLAIFILAVLGMAVGYIFKNKCLQGTCGGLANMTDDSGKSICDACETPSPECATKFDQANEVVSSTASVES